MSDTDTEPLAARDRPDLTRLTDEQNNRVLDTLAARGLACGACGENEFEVGHALYVGFLFLQEELDAYMVAVTCRNPQCRAPRTGVRLRESEFMSE